MAIEKMDSNKIAELQAELEQSLYRHEKIFHEVTRSVACKIPYEEHDCRFQSDIPGIKNSHQVFHEQCKKIVSILADNNDFNVAEYDLLAHALENFKIAIYAYRKELEITSKAQHAEIFTAARVTMLPTLREQQSYAKRQSQPCSIAIVDIDLLEKIRNEFGNVAKDVVLVNIAQFLVNHVRKYDKVFCYSNESFLVSLQQVDAKQTLELIDRLRVKISKTPINIGLEEPLYVTVSCGVTAMDPTFTVEQSLDQASIALYLAKKSGNNNSKLWVNEPSSK